VPGLRRRGGRRGVPIRPVAVARLVGYMLVTMVRSNVGLTRAVLSSRSRLRTAIIGVPLPACSDELLTLISNLLALSPGTMPIEMRSNPVVLYVHVLHLTDIERVRRDILHLTNLTVRAFGTADVIAEQAAYTEAHR
jgi:multicomponent Na+:H+ antiporter subunit E